MKIEKIVVIGSGAMGSGIAYVCASAGKKVTIVDQNEEFLNKGMSKIRQDLKSGIERGKLTPAKGMDISQNINQSTNLAEVVKDADLVIEAVYEDMVLKKEIFATLSDHASENAILASNTSTLSISEMAMNVKNPDRVVGVHFFNPPAAMKLVEIIKGSETSQGTLDICSDFANTIGKTPVIAKDSPGFIVNRLLVPMLNEAVKLLDEGIASAEDIDKATVLGANFPLGPLALSDMVGLDVALASLRTLEREFGDAYKPSPTLVKLVSEGKLGMKTGEGFYKY